MMKKITPIALLIPWLLSACGPEATQATKTSPPRPPLVLGMTNLVRIEPGTFLMGSPSNEVNLPSVEDPQTRVIISQGFWMGKHEVTQNEYLSLMGKNPSSNITLRENDLNQPVDRVSWTDATNYCGKRTEQERMAGRLPRGYIYRLPTEAEWEYTCRAGTTTRFSFGDDPNLEDIDRHAWYSGNNGKAGEPNYGPKAVGQKLPNPWGLFDMHGNVAEWCLDGLAKYSGGTVTNQFNVTTNESRVVRGGSVSSTAEACRSAYRMIAKRKLTPVNVGFRVALVPQ